MGGVEKTMLMMRVGLGVARALVGMGAIARRVADRHRNAITREGAADDEEDPIDIDEKAEECIQDAQVRDELTSNHPPRSLRGCGGILGGLSRHDRGRRAMAAWGLEPKLTSRPYDPMHPAPELAAIALMYQVCPGSRPKW